MWIEALRETLRFGVRVEDYVELLNLPYVINAPTIDDPLLARWADSSHIREMRKVFRGDGPNRFGHSYKERMIGPVPGDAIEGVVAALSRDAKTRRAVITLVGSGQGDVPCVNAIQFLVRGDTVLANALARGQDLYNKFYADALAILDLADEVRRQTARTHIALIGSIGSAHVYEADLASANTLLEAADGFVECAR